MQLVDRSVKSIGKMALEPGIGDIALRRWGGAAVEVREGRRSSMVQRREEPVQFGERISGCSRSAKS